MNKNLLAFFVFSAAVLGVSMYLQSQMAQQKVAEKKNQTKDEAKKDADKKGDAKVADAKNDKKDGDKKADDKKDEKKPDPIPAPKDVADFMLGDEASNLSLVVTNRGAGVRKLTMNRFKTADYLGRPVDKNLDFIQDDPFISSFRMYHYAEAEAERPALGMGEALWNVVGDGVEKDGDGWKIAFWTEVPDLRNVKIIKTYRLQPGDYHIGLTIEMANKSAAKTQFRYQMDGSHGLPVEGEWYTPPTSIRNAVIGMVNDRNYLERKIEDSGRISTAKEGERIVARNTWMQYAGVMTQYFASVLLVDHDQIGFDWKANQGILTSARASRESTEVKAKLLVVDGDVVVFQNDKNESVVGKMLPRAKEHLATLGLVPGSRCVVNFSTEPKTGQAIVNWFRLGQTPLGYFDDITVRVNSDIVSIPAGGSVSHKFMLYHGPVKTRLLGQTIEGSRVSRELVDKYTDTMHLNTLTDYPSDSIFGRISRAIGWNFLLIQCTRLMHFLLYWLHFISFGNWGISIILLTIIVRGAMYPISHKQALMSQKMQLLAPEIKKLQEKFKDDKAAQAQATMELYRKHKVSPAGGCLPLMMQMPIFMGLYFCLQESVQFRLAKFIWIENLAAPDMLFWWGQSIPWFTDPDSLGNTLYLGPFFNLLPLLAVGFMIVQQKMMTPPPQNEEQAMQQRMMKIMMGVMGIFFYKVAAGLCIYFISSSLWGVIERKMLPKKTLATVTGPSSNSITAAKPVLNSRERRREMKRMQDEPVTTWEKIKKWWQDLLESAEKK
jgi:YidC/Oxa1 family membrane protein insertase